MKRRRSGRKGAAPHRQSSPQKVGCWIALIALIPILYGLYLYCRQCEPFLQTGHRAESRTAYTVSAVEELEIPVSSLSRQEQVIRHQGYTVSYNRDWRLPNWVSYELTRRETSGKEKRSNRFTDDPQVVGPIATNADYARSGYDKGHMAPAADMKWSLTAMKECFYFSNICPQHPQLNRRGWKDLEEKVRDWVREDSALVVICGPIVGRHPRTIGESRVAVPDQFFKVILSPFTRPMRAIGFLYDNARAVEPPAAYAVSVDSIESLTHLDFFSSLPDEVENEIESKADYSLWEGR